MLRRGTNSLLHDDKIRDWRSRLGRCEQTTLNGSKRILSVARRYATAPQRVPATTATVAVICLVASLGIHWAIHSCASDGFGSRGMLQLSNVWKHCCSLLVGNDFCYLRVSQAFFFLGARGREEQIPKWFVAAIAQADRPHQIILVLIIAAIIVTIDYFIKRQDTTEIINISLVWVITPVITRSSSSSSNIAIPLVKGRNIADIELVRIFFGRICVDGWPECVMRRWWTRRAQKWWRGGNGNGSPSWFQAWFVEGCTHWDDGGKSKAQIDRLEHLQFLEINAFTCQNHHYVLTSWFGRYNSDKE